MSNGYDFSDDEEVLKEQREYAKKADEWTCLDEKAMAAELGTLNSRVSACAKQINGIMEENDYTKTYDMLRSLVMHDLSAEGWLFTFYDTNKDYFSNVVGDSHPDWLKGSNPETIAKYDAALKYYRDVQQLLKIRASLYSVLMPLKLAEGFKLLRVRVNFDEAGFVVDFYNKVNTDIQRASDFLNQDWDQLEKNAHLSKNYIDANLGKGLGGELEKGYRARRLEDFQGLVSSWGLLDAFVESADGHYSAKPDILAKASVIDRYTCQIAQTDNLKEPMQKTMDDCKKIIATDIAEAEKLCTTQAAQFLCAAFHTLAEAVSDFADSCLLTYVNFKEAGNMSPFCFMKKLSCLSNVKPIYGFHPNTVDPWDSGTYYKDLYTEAATALGAQARLFAYDHGTKFL